jgi:hypothetical protein
LRSNLLWGAIWQFRASPALTAYSNTFSLRTGNTPGIPKQTGQTLVFGGAPNWVEQLQNIFELVVN